MVNLFSQLHEALSAAKTEFWLF